jgi:hypothetical protein
MTMLMASMALQDLQQNRDMRKISAWVAIAAVPTMVAGIYGMNFDNMPSCARPGATRQSWPSSESPAACSTAPSSAAGGCRQGGLGGQHSPG